ncbi:MAG: cellulose biosynthesis cyclic di-GMP-binding regulatory protein BcsB [Pseudomonadota bacterium]
MTPLLRSAALLAALSLPLAANAQAPFSVRGDAEASGLPGVANPTTQRNIAAQEAAGLSPNNPRTSQNQRPGADAATGIPAPFDINQDGTSPVVVIPEEEQTIFRPFTTTSPLANGRRPGPVLPVDAVSREQRENITRLLKEDADTVRELRVNVENAQEWVEAVVDRPIVPFRTLRLDGEIDSTSWTFFLSGAEAARGGTLAIAFTNSVLVLPEASRLRIFLNGRQIAQTAIDSPDRTKVIALPIPSELVRPGENALRLETEMRHRIDCSLLATYELWTRIDTRLTGFSFGGGRTPLAGLNDLPGVGVGTNGATRIRVMQRAPSTVTSVDRMLRAVQAASVRGRFVQPLVEVVPITANPEPMAGTVNIVIGTYDQIRTISPDIPAEGGVGPLTTLIDTARLGPTVVIAGPNERAVDAALSRFDVASGDNAPRSPIIATPPWLVPDSVRVNGADTITLREAGVETINFSGRRFVTDFKVTLPPDFYAAAYGEAQLLLDAAYSSDVEPGSRLSVFVNGILSTAISFTSSDGEVYDDFPIVLVMKHFRPGINNIEIVADIETEADEACLPGGTVPARDRFALFSSSRLVFPDFARIGQVPNLASFATNGFPYPLSNGPVRVRVASDSLDTVGAAGTLLSRVAVSRGAPLATNVVETVSAFTDTGAIIVAPLQEVSSLTLETTDANRVIPSNWLQPFSTGRVGEEPQGLERYDDVLRRLRQQLRQEEVRLDRTADVPSDPARSDVALDQRSETERTRDRWFEELEAERGIGGAINDLVQTVRDALNLDLSFGEDSRQAEVEISPVSEGATLLFAQAEAPNNANTAWTLVTAPTPGLLSTSMAAVSSPDQWTRIGGRITAYDLENNAVETVAVDSVGYLATLPLSFRNLRLIAANWFSINNGFYALALIAIAVLLGLVTWLLVSPLGRKN